MSRVVWRDTGYRRTMTALKELTRYIVRVGVLNEDATRIHPLRSTMTVGTVARMQEYGASRANIPRRSFLREVAHEHHAEVVEGYREAIRSILNGGYSWSSLFEMGAKFKDYVIKRIMDGNIPPPLAPFTVAKKGHSETLQDTLTLSKSISHETITRAAASSGSNEDVF